MPTTPHFAWKRQHWRTPSTLVLCSNLSFVDPSLLFQSISCVCVQRVASAEQEDGSDGFITQVYNIFDEYRGANDDPDCWEEAIAFKEVRNSVIAAGR